MAAMMQAQSQLRRSGSLRTGQDPSYASVPGGLDEEPGSGRQINDCEGVLNIIQGQPILTCMLIFVPIGYAAHFLNMDAPFVFGFNFLAIIPLAWLIGKATEDAAASVGQTLGGLMNASFGNIVEMLLCVVGIRKNQIVVVQCTLLGSILSNMLLVLGTAFLVGGMYKPTQYFSQQGAATQCSLMAMAVFAIGLPTLYADILRQDEEWEHMVEVSRWASVFLLLTYVAYLYFQLGTHRSLFEGDDDDEDEDPPDLSPGTASILLALTTVVTALSAEFLIDALEETIATWNVSKEFVGIILLPIIGNAAEHYTAITVAAKDKMDISLGVAAGSSCQMALLVTPFTVLVGWAYDREMTLDFHAFQVAVLLLAVFLTTTILSNGESNWLEGVMLLVTYIILALIYFCEGDGAESSLATLA